MIPKPIVLLLFASLLLACGGKQMQWFEQESFFAFKDIDKFETNGYQVVARFYEPSKNISRTHPQYFGSAPEQERAAIWKDYIMHSTIYLFIVRDGKAPVRYYALQGTTQKKSDFDNFLQFVSIDTTMQLIDPNTQAYAQAVRKTFPVPVVGGFVFDNMDIFDQDENKQFIEEGLLLHGEYFRVTRYSEIRAAVSDLIDKDLPAR